MTRTKPLNYEHPPDSLLEENEDDLVLQMHLVDGVVVEEWITRAEARRRHEAALAAASEPSREP